MHPRPVICADCGAELVEKNRRGELTCPVCPLPPPPPSDLIHSPRRPRTRTR